jgi:hypothetical protein
MKTSAPTSLHTPGDWTLSGTTVVLAKPHNHVIIAQLGSANNADHEEVAANGRLIVAAPTMLSIIDESLEMLQGNPSPEAIETVRAMLAVAMDAATVGRLAGKQA